MNKIIWSRIEPREFQVPKKGRVLPSSRAARVAAWILSKTKHRVEVDVSETSYDRMEVDLHSLDEVVQAILSQRHLLMIFNQEIDRIVLGEDLYRKFISVDISNPFAIQHDMRVGYGKQTRMFGILIQVIPNMEGFAILPKIENVVSASTAR